MEPSNCMTMREPVGEGELDWAQDMKTQTNAIRANTFSHQWLLVGWGE